MLTRLDDYLVHQIVDTVDHVGTSDPNFYDRYWFELGDIEGELLISVGMAVYPNRQVMDGYATATVDDSVQHNLRVSRDMAVGTPDRLDSQVGPVRVEVLEGLKKLRIVVEPNRFDISCDIVFDAPQGPFERPIDFTRNRGRIVNNTCHFNQSAHLTGTATVGNRTWQVTPERWYGVRDRSWGVRTVGEPDRQPLPRSRGSWLSNPEGAVWQWLATQWPDHYTYWHRLDVGTETTRGTWGDVIYPGKEPLPIVEAHMTHIDYAPLFDMHKVRQAGFEFTDAEGRTRLVEARHISTTYLRGGAYGGIDDFNHGAYKGEYHEEGETWRFDNEDDMRKARVFGIVDHLAEFECEGVKGYGIFEFSDDPAFKWFERYAPDRVVVRS